MRHAAEIVGVYSIACEEPCHLVELSVVSDDVAAFIDGITQADDSLARENWQVPWAEQVLSVDNSVNRIVFFFHYLDVTKPLETPAGPLQIPKPTEYPDRLKFITYEPP